MVTPGAPCRVGIKPANGYDPGRPADGSTLACGRTDAAIRRDGALWCQAS
jgi:hypothetical protein